MQIQKYYPVLATANPSASSAFYTRHLGFRAVFVTDWFVFLVHPTSEEFALGLVDQDHESVPSQARTPAQGVLLTLEVPDVDAAYATMLDEGLSVVAPVRDEAWGQRHFIVDAPDGVLLDVVTPIPPSDEFASAYDQAS